TTHLIACMSFVWAMTLGVRPSARAQGSTERFLFTGGQVWVVHASQPALIEDNIELPNNITVSTNGTFKVGTHSPRAFAEGQVLCSDGMLISPNGKIEPVLDHVALAAGRTVSSVNGINSAI